MSKRDSILNEYIAFIKKHGRFPKNTELQSTRESVRHNFKSYDILKQAAIDTGTIDNYIFDVTLISPRDVAHIKKRLKKFNRLVITTAVSNAKVNMGALNSIRGFCKHERGHIIVMPATNTGSGDKWTIAPEVRNESVIFYDISLNSNLSILGLSANAKTSDPITGLPKLSRSRGSIICASPKQSLKFVPTGINKLPHAIMSTGAITYPEYKHSAFARSKQEYIADNDHVMGALIVELDENDTFHFRQIQFDKHGGFADLGSYYRGNRKVKYVPSAIVLGDLHSGETDPVVLKATEDISKAMKVKEWILHDIFTGLSCNPYEMEKRILLSKRAERGELSIDREIKGVSDDLKAMTKHLNKITVVRSNHDDFINRYLESGAYVNHPYNHRTALMLALDLLDDKNPLEEQCRRNGVPKSVKFLGRDESYKIAGVELGQHFDKGQNGAKASLKGLEESYGACIGGHSHSAGIRGLAYQVGTSTFMQLTYNQGASSWTHTHCLLYSNGSRQLIHCINGKFTTRKI